jgi:molybdate transport system regulatory protein
MKNDIRPVVKIFFASSGGGRGEPFLGPGMISLLEKIREVGNVRKACEKMNVSYSKGWKLLNTLEKFLPFSAVQKRQGGKGGGDTRLTPEGEAFLAKRRAFETDCERQVEKIYEKYYGNRRAAE